MNLSDIPASVLQFIAQNIDSVPQLEGLLLLWENQSRAWSDDEIAARLYVSRSEAASILLALQRRQLTALDADPPPKYRYNPGWDTTGLMHQVAVAYRRHLVPVATFIHSRAPSAVREFARAFDLKKDR
jgi:hypothetical protein